jgi:hypothetical protein
LLGPVTAAIVASGVVIGAALWFTRARPPVQAPSPPAVSAAVVETLPEPEPSAAPAEIDTPPSEVIELPDSPKPRSSAARGKPAAAPSNTIEEKLVPETPKPETPTKVSEATLLDQARVALKTDPKRALDLANEHRRRYPHGVLSEEREVIAMQAMKRLGMTDAARSRANDFRSKHPESVHSPNVDQAAGD